MSVLVIGGTGKVGTVLVRRLLDLGADVSVLVRSADRVALLPPDVRAHVAAIVDDPESARPAFVGADQVFMLNRPTSSEVVEGVLAIQLARDAGVRRFVYQAVFEADHHAQLPHIASKIAICAALKRSGMAWTILRPNHFFQNDWMTRQPLLAEGRYALPVGPIGCSSVDARDIAEAAARVLGSDGHAFEEYPIVGPQVLAGAGCAAAWSRALGRDVGYDASPEAWSASMATVMPAWLRFDLSRMYAAFGREGFVGGEADLERTSALLGRMPRAYDEFVAEMAALWGPTPRSTSTG